MADLKWIKINLGMFDDEKIRFVETLPEADTILVIWIKLLTLAGKSNAGGYVLLTERIPYTDEMLSNQFNRPLNTVRLALQTFVNLEMIEWDESGIEITNWGKHQNQDAMEKIREQNRLRQAKRREKQQAQLTVAAEHEREIPYQEIVEYLNLQSGKRFKWASEKTKKAIRARFNEGFKSEDFRTVIDKKSAAWKGTNMDAYLRPETIFGTKFEGYLNESVQAPTNQRPQRPQNEFDAFLEDDDE